MGKKAVPMGDVPELLRHTKPGSIAYWNKDMQQAYNTLKWENGPLIPPAVTE